MGRKSNIVQAVIFLMFISAFFILNAALPDREFSERENRYLTRLPEFSFRNLFEGKFTKDFESYTTDQFAFRDSWTALKARSELMIGKDENNGVYYCDDGVLIERFENSGEAQLDANIAAVNALAGNVDVPVYFALVPGASEVWSHKMPENAPGGSQLEVMTYAYGNSEARPVDVYSALKSHKAEYIYYHTDHHWTSLGAYYGYTALMEAMGLEYSPITSYSRKTVSREFYGTVYSSSGFSWVEPDSIEVFVQPGDSVQVTNFPSGNPVSGTIYDESFLEKKDKYSMFMGGNTPLLQIDTGNAGLQSILILRDSYIDSQIPFLLEHFSEIHVIDLRYFRSSLKEYIETNAIDNILVCYSVSNFCTDNSLFLLGR